MFGGNGWAAVQILLGAPFWGRPALMLNLAAGDSQLVYMLNHSGCPLVFADEENMPRLRLLARRCDNPPRLEEVSRDEDIGDITVSDNNDDNKVEEIKSGEAAEDNKSGEAAEAADSAALLIYTSGTTGTPKGVLHSHRSMLAGGANTAVAHALSENDRALCVLPLYHINGQCVTIIAPLLSGGSVLLPHKFSAGDFWNLLAAHECTWFSAVPTIISHLLHSDAAPPPLPLLRFGRSASSALPPETHRQFERRFGVQLVETMGLTETAAQILSNPPPPLRGKIGSPGKAVGNEVRIVAKDGKTAATDEEGEIAVRGDNVMKHYWPDGAATTADGWLLTGDLGRMDADGYVFVTGRLKELIIKGGENISPREIDDALYAAPGVVEAAAFAVDCATYGQQVEAAVALASPDAHSEAELIALCEKHAGKFKSPRRIHFLKSLPKGPSGKIQRLKLAEMLRTE